METAYRKANAEDAELLIDIYNAAFYRDYLKYGTCPGYGKTKEMMAQSIADSHKFINSHSLKKRRKVWAA